MKKPVFKGAATALVTPFTIDGAVDYDALGKLIDMQIRAGISALVICGTTGETPTLSDEEFCSILSFSVERAAGRTPIIAGTGRNSTLHSVEMSKKAEQIGADALLLVTPYYNKTTQSGLVKHYYTVADAVDLPMIVYSVPSRTGMNIEPETQLKLSEHKNIYGIKDASGNFSAMIKARALCPDDFALYSGNDDQTVPILSIGGSGVISVLSNIMPAETEKMCFDYFTGDVETAFELQRMFQPMIEALFKETSPLPIKKAMELMGLCTGVCRAPLYEVSVPTRDFLEKQLKAFSLI